MKSGTWNDLWDWRMSHGEFRKGKYCFWTEHLHMYMVVLLVLTVFMVKSCNKNLRSGRALTVLRGEEGARNAEDTCSTKCRPFIPPQSVEEVKGFSLEKPLCLARSFPPILTKDGCLCWWLSVLKNEFGLGSWAAFPSDDRFDNNVKRCFYQSRRALPISSLRLAKHSVEMSLVYTVKISRSVQWLLLNLRQGFQCWTPEVVHLRQAQPSSLALGRGSAAQGGFIWAQVRSFWESDTGLSGCVNLDKKSKQKLRSSGSVSG